MSKRKWESRTATKTMVMCLVFIGFPTLFHALVVPILCINYPQMTAVAQTSPYVITALGGSVAWIVHSIQRRISKENVAKMGLPPEMQGMMPQVPPVSSSGQDEGGAL